MHAKAAKGLYEDSLKSYYESVKRIPLLTADDERDLSMRIQDGDEAARARLIESNLRLVIKIARSFANFDVSLIDLIQEGNAGLIKAAERFDYRKNVRFSTYASWWIKQAITRSLVNTRRAIRLPHRKEELIRRIHKAHAALSQLYAREPSYEELAKELGISAASVREALDLSGGVVPLEVEKDDDEGGSIIDVYEDLSYSPDQQLEKECERERTLSLLEELMERERTVLMYRFEFFGAKKSTLKVIGQSMGISAETVRQIEKRALRKLREKNDEYQSYLGSA
jgi:RNA polymerase primary sigma factor